MGQRSQIYIKLPNFGKVWAKQMKLESIEVWQDNLPGFVEKQAIYDKWKQMYGENDTIILAFHHQWLYGRSFVQVASNILFYVKELNKSKYQYNNILSTEYEYLENPNDPINWIQNVMQNLFDFDLSKYARTGVERLTNLNEEHIEDKSLHYSEDFTCGDNNDGVLLMDFISKKPKYCFININSTETEEYKRLVPVDAYIYIKQYYSETMKALSDETTTPTTIGEAEKKIQTNIKVNKKFIKRFKGIEVLSVQEITNMFPAMKEELLAENCNAVLV